MKICVITSSFPKCSGDSTTGSFIFELFRRLGNADCNVHVVAPHEFGLAKSEIMDGVVGDRFVDMLPHYLQRLAYGSSIAENIKKSKFVTVQVLTYSVSCLLRALHVIRSSGVDAIVACWTIPQGLIAMILRTVTKKPVVLMAFPVELSLAISRYRFLMPLMRLTLSKADLVIANSQYTKNLVLSLGIPPQKVHVVYPGVDTRRYLSTRHERVRKEFGLPNAPTLLTVARLVERKGIKNLVQAMPQILTTMPTAMLVIVGDGPERTRLKEEVRRLKLSDNVAFMGKVAEDKLLSLYEISDVFVLPAIVDSDGNTEGLGVVLLEAMSTQKPVVASRVGGIPEVVVHEQTGMLVEPGNPDELASAITYLLRNDRISAKMGRKGRQRAEQIFDWNLIASSFSELLETRGLASINNSKISDAEKAIEPRLVVPVASNHT